MAIKYKPAVEVELSFHEGPIEYESMPKASYRTRASGGFWCRCGDCGFLLSCNHSIDSAGKVTPSIGCPFCGWHVWAMVKPRPTANGEE